MRTWRPLMGAGNLTSHLLAGGSGSVATVVTVAPGHRTMMKGNARLNGTKLTPSHGLGVLVGESGLIQGVGGGSGRWSGLVAKTPPAARASEKGGTP